MRNKKQHHNLDEFAKIDEVCNSKMSEKLCFQLNDFQDHTTSAFANLRDEKDFVDVTLVCEDGQQVEAHKVFLASSSQIFQQLLVTNKHQHPLIYMRKIKHEHILSVLDFIYHGVVNVFQDDLDSFLAIAEELQLKGLTAEAKLELDEKALPTKFRNKSLKRDPDASEDPSSEIHDIPAVTDATLALDLGQLDEKVKSMMDKSENKIANGPYQTTAYQCKVCGKEGLGRNIKDHIEANHLEGIFIPCNFCSRTFRSRNGWRQHKRIQHSSSPPV